MMSKSKVIRFLSLSLAVIGFVLIAGSLNETKAQCNGDPFCLPTWKKPKVTTPAIPKDGKTTPVKKGPAPVMPVTAPPIAQRIEYYKRIREEAAANGMPIPKVTTVLTLDEMVVTGIFKTPRGYSAMVEATPIKLSFTVYPGEKFFDGRLVAIEENRVIFSKVTKMNNNKFITSVENKALRQYTIQQEVQTPVEPQPTTAQTNNNSGQTEIVENKSPNPQPQVQNVAPTTIISPVDEMTNQPEEKPKDSVKEKNTKKSKKPVKVAKKS
jgi:hypothetical protein